MENNRKGYKGFGPGLVCRGKQYAENTVFEEPTAEICRSGMHYCTNPLDVLDYYPLIDDNGEPNEFAEVEALEESETDDQKKFCTTRLRIGAKLSFRDFVKASIDVVFNRCKADFASGDSAKLASSGDSAQLASSGDSAKLASSGDSAKLASSGYFAQLASSGDSAKLASSGDSAKLASSGDSAKLASSGDSAQLASSGDSAKLASSGDSAKLASSGDSAKLASSGYFAQLASSGDSAKLASSGYFAQLASSGKNSVVAAIGANSRVKGAAGNWLVIAEWGWVGGEYKPRCVKAVQVDGEKIKADTWYKLENGEFVEVK